MTNYILAMLVTLLATNAPVSVGTYHDKRTGLTYDVTESVVVSNLTVVCAVDGQSWRLLVSSTPLWTNPPVRTPVATQPPSPPSLPSWWFNTPGIMSTNLINVGAGVNATKQ